MLTPEESRKIQDFVSVKPRTVQEIAHLLERNWRTADSYVERIASETGKIGCRTFRGGTKGALKIVYWKGVESVRGSAVQERLFEEIKSKGSFSAFDIYQYCNEKSAFLEMQEDEPKKVFHPLIKTLQSAQKQVLIFSGNFSWAHLSQEGVSALEVLESLAERGVSVKVIANVDLDAFANIEKVLLLNKRLGDNMIEIRHAVQPLRGFVIDDELVRFKEARDAKGKKKTFIFYTVKDKDWVEWVQKLFWNLFSSGISAEKRMHELKGIENVKGV